MGFFSRLFGQKRETRDIGDGWVIPSISNIVSSAPDKNSTLVACINLIASAIASLPLTLYRKKSDGTRVRATDHTLYHVVKYSPNFDYTPALFYFSLIQDYYRAGNIFLYKYMDEKNNALLALYRFDPNKVKIETADGKKIYKIGNKKYTSEKVLHIPSLLGFDGEKGISISAYARSTLKLTTDLDNYLNNSFENSLGKRLVIDISKALPAGAKPEQITELRNRYVGRYSNKPGEPIIKTSEVDFDTIDSGLPDSRAQQLIENRAFQEKEIAKLFGIPLAFFNGENKYGGLEALYTIFLTNAILPISRHFEQSFNRLLSPGERFGLYFEFDYTNLMRVDLAARIDAYTKQISNGMLSPNEAREAENRPAIEAGDIHFVPANLMPLTLEIIEAYMASAKLKAKESQGLGSDKL